MMAKKYFQKALSVGLSLALCAGLVAPSLAATFTNLNDAIKGNEYREYDGGIIATQGEDGNRRLQLTQEVKCDGDTGNNMSIIIEGVKVVIDLNGFDIVGNKNNGGSSVIWVNGVEAELTLEDSTAHTDEDGNYVSGKVTGSVKNGVWVNEGGKFVMSSGEISGNSNGAGGPEEGGGGVRVEGPSSSFTMNGGRITGNSAKANGGGVLVRDGGTFNMTAGEISGNKSNFGGGVAVIGKNGDKSSSFNMSGSAVLKNNELNPNAPDYGNKLPSDVFVKQGGQVTVAANIRTPANEPLNGFKQHATGAYNWDNVTDVTAPAGEVTYSGETLLKLEYGDPIVTPAGPIGAPETIIDEPAVPLAAGPVTRAEFIDYLWRHENAPEGGECTFTDVAEDHDFILALGWAEQNSVAEANEDGTFEPDELVTVAAVREFLGNFADVFGMDVDVYALATLTGDEDEAVLNCDEVLAEFFGEELAEQAA